MLQTRQKKRRRAVRLPKASISLLVAVIPSVGGRGGASLLGSHGVLLLLLLARENNIVGDEGSEVAIELLAGIGRGTHPRGGVLLNNVLLNLPLAGRLPALEGPAALSVFILSLAGVAAGGLKLGDGGVLALLHVAHAELAAVDLGAAEGDGLIARSRALELDVADALVAAAGAVADDADAADLVDAIVGEEAPDGLVGGVVGEVAQEGRGLRVKSLRDGILLRHDNVAVKEDHAALLDRLRDAVLVLKEDIGGGAVLLASVELLAENADGAAALLPLIVLREDLAADAGALNLAAILEEGEDLALLDVVGEIADENGTGVLLDVAVDGVAEVLLLEALVCGEGLPLVLTLLFAFLNLADLLVLSRLSDAGGLHFEEVEGNLLVLTKGLADGRGLSRRLLGGLLNSLLGVAIALGGALLGLAGLLLLASLGGGGGLLGLLSRDGGRGSDLLLGEDILLASGDGGSEKGRRERHIFFIVAQLLESETFASFFLFVCLFVCLFISSLCLL